MGFEEYKKKIETVRDIVVENGYLTAYTNGRKTEKLHLCAFGILKPREPYITECVSCGDEMEYTPRALHVGNLWFRETKSDRIGCGHVDYDRSCTAEERNSWLLNVYGEKNLDEMKQLANKISAKVGKDIKVELKMAEYLKLERKWYDVFFLRFGQICEDPSSLTPA